MVVLTPRFGDRFSTIALSIPHQSVYVVTGVNVEMLCCLTKLSHPLRAQISAQASPASTDQMVDSTRLTSDHVGSDDEVKAAQWLFDSSE